MVIAHVITRLLRAGSEENTLASCVAQARAGNRVLLLHGPESNEMHRARFGAEIEFVEVPDMVHQINSRKDIAAVRAMRALFLRERPDIVHTHQSKAGVLGRIAARMAKTPLIVHGVHIVPFVGVGAVERAVYLAAERAMAVFTDAFINVSEGTRETCLQFSVGRPEQHFVAHSGMDLSRFRDATWPDAWEALLGVQLGAPRPPTVLMLAALEKRKRHVEFLDSFRRVIERVPTVRLLLAGEGPHRAAVEQAIETRGLQEHVKLLGFTAEPERLIALCDLTVLTSMREGLPRVLVQSIAGGRPVVTSYLPGIDALIRSGRNGIVSPAEDVGHTADAIAELLLHPERLAQMQRAAAGTDVSSWDVATMCTTISGIYEQLQFRASDTGT